MRIDARGRAHKVTKVVAAYAQRPRWANVV
jgi:hypothetical protein